MKRQFDVVANPDGSTRAKAPFLVVLQSHHLDGLDTVLVAPLFKTEVIPPDEVIALSVHLGDDAYVLNVSLLAAISLRNLGRTVASLSSNDYEISRALDRLFTGF